MHEAHSTSQTRATLVRDSMAHFLPSLLWRTSPPCLAPTCAPVRWAASSMCRRLRGTEKEKTSAWDGLEIGRRLPDAAMMDDGRYRCHRGCGCRSARTSILRAAGRWLASITVESACMTAGAWKAPRHRHPPLTVRDDLFVEMPSTKCAPPCYRSHLGHIAGRAAANEANVAVSCACEMSRPRSAVLSCRGRRTSMRSKSRLRVGVFPAQWTEALGDGVARKRSE